MNRRGLDKPTRQHGIGDLDEARDVGALHIVHESIAVLAVGDASIMNVRQDALKPRINLLECPGDAQRVLALLQTGYGHATRVGCLGGAERNPLPAEEMDGVERGDKRKPVTVLQSFIDFYGDTRWLAA